MRYIVLENPGDWSANSVTLISTSLMYKILDCDDGPHHKHDVHAFQALQLIFGLLHK
jgi:hypothetical protein